MKIQHKHAALIKQWADGEEIEYLRSDGSWRDCDNPTWFLGDVYRIKPAAPKPDSVLNCQALPYMVHYGSAPVGGDNLRLTFDGETGKLKSAEVLEIE